MTNQVYFSKMRVNATTKNVTIYVTSAPRQQAALEVLGFAMALRVQDSILNGQLNLVDPKTGTSMKSDHPLVKKMQASLKPGDAMPGLGINQDNPVVDLETGEPLRNLYWVEAAV
jgi:hypothetical protein